MISAKVNAKEMDKMNNFWRIFFDRYSNFFPDDASRNDRNTWENLINSENGYKYALRLLAIAYLTSNNDDDEVTYRGLLVNYPKWYNSFSQHAVDLENQLNSLGVELLRSANGADDRQYLRTILKYSGNMYVCVARRIAQQVHSWNIEQVRDYLNQFRTRNNEEQNATVDDAERFFVSIGNMYRRTNLPPSLEDVKECCTDLPDNVINKVYSILFIENNQNNCLETRPIIGMFRGNVCFILPEQGIFRKGIIRAVFVFKNGIDDFTVVEYRSNNNWRRTQLKGTVPVNIHSVSGIKLLLWRDNNTKHEEDVIPDICQQDVILFDDEQHPVEKLCVGGTYSVVQVRGNTTRIVCWTLDNADQQEEIVLDNENRFTVPDGTIRITINNEEIPLRNSYLDWIDSSNDFCKISGSRLLISASQEDGFLCNSIRRNDIIMQYGDTQIYSYGKGWTPPLTWQRESLQVFRNDHCVFRYPVTFIDDISIDNTELNDFKPVPFGDQRRLNVNIGNENYDVFLGEKDLKISIEHNGFDLNIRIPRKGVYIQLPEKDIIPILPEKPHSDLQVTELSLDDFNRGVCHIVNCCQGRDSIIFSRGNNLDEIETNGQGCISFKLKRKMQGNVSQSEKRSRFCSIFISPEEIYRFRIYNPIEKKILGTDRSINWERLNNDLIIRYYVSRLNSTGEKYIVFYPAHLQDQPYLEFRADSVELCREDKSSAYVQKLIFNDFFIKKIEWGAGLLAFIATKERYCNGNERNRVVSSGFFLPTPNGFNRDIGIDPNGLRTAIANCDIPNICEIMRSEDTNVRKEVRDFIQNMTREIGSLDLNVFNYLNSFWNRLYSATEENLNDPHKQSGYIFQAGWFFVNGPGAANNRCDLNDNYRPYWSYWLFGQEYWLRPQGQQEQLEKLYRTNIWEIVCRDGILSDEQKKVLIGLVNPNNENDNDQDNLILSEDVISTYPQLSEIVREAVDTNNEIILGELENMGWAKHLLELWREYRRNNNNQILDKIVSYKGEGIRSVCKQRPWEKCDRINKFTKQSYLYYTGYQYNNNKALWIYHGRIDKSVSFTQLKNFLENIAQKLADWRLDPTLKESQKLREILITLRNIDDFLCMVFGDEYFPMCYYIHNMALFINDERNMR